MGYYKSNGMIPGGLVIFERDRILRIWSRASKQPVNIGKVLGDNIPDLDSVKGIALTENGIVFILDDEQFLLLRRNNAEIHNW